jgi:hypothetical protein
VSEKTHKNSKICQCGLIGFTISKHADAEIVKQSEKRDSEKQLRCPALKLTVLLPGAAQQRAYTHTRAANHTAGRATNHSDFNDLLFVRQTGFTTEHINSCLSLARAC